MTIETKMSAPSGANADARAMAGEVMAAFEALKAAHDARIEEVEKRGAVDPVLEANGGVQNFDAIKVMKFAAS